jgi:hypothetical protein
MPLDAVLRKECYLTMERLNSVHENGLTADSFIRYPIWVWDDSKEGYHPLVGQGPMPDEFGTLFVRATFVPPSGREITGYLIGLRSFYAVGLFVNGEHFVLNRNAPDLAALTMKSIGPKLSGEPLLPLRYRSDVLKGQTPIEGVFEF